MAITYPLTMPTEPSPRDVEWIPQSSVAVSRSPFTFAEKVFDWGGKIFGLRIEFPPMSETDAAVWQAWILKLNGSAGTFYFSDTIGAAGNGTVNGNPVVNGAGQTGQTLNTTGWDPGDEVVTGDWISIEDRLYKILEDASESSGNMALTLWPAVDAPADTAPLSYGVSARGLFRLDGFPSWNWAPDFTQAPVTLLATEALA